MLPSAEALHLRRPRRNLFGVLPEQDLEGNRNPQGGVAEAEERAAAGRMKTPKRCPNEGGIRNGRHPPGQSCHPHTGCRRPPRLPFVCSWHVRGKKGVVRHLR